MTTQQTPRFTVPDPDRPPMTPLPAELLTRILKFAQAGERVPEQHSIRLVFEKVCRAWYFCDYKWRVVAVDGSDNVEKLIAQLSAPGVAERVKSLHVTLSGWLGRQKGDTVAQLLRLVGNVETLELVVSPGALGQRKAEYLGDVVPGALATLAKVKHFAIGGSANLIISAMFTNTDIRFSELVPLFASWPALESLAIKNCRLFLKPDVPSLNGLLPSLDGFELDQASQPKNERNWFLYELPTATHSVALNVKNIFGWQRSRPDLNSDEQGIELARRLSCLTLVDGTFPHSSLTPRSRERGQLDNFVANLDNVEDLTISPVAISNIASLAALTRLTHLCLVTGLHSTRAPVDPAELVALFGDSRSLKRISIQSSIARRWSTEEKEQLEHAAQPNIALAWV